MRILLLVTLESTARNYKFIIIKLACLCVRADLSLRELITNDIFRDFFFRYSKWLPT